MKNLSNRVAYLDFLRGIAILSVLVVHTNIFILNKGGVIFNLITSEGARGVQLFYILSAMTLFMSLSQGSYVGNKNQIFKYFLRRFFRIAPLFYFIIIFCVLLSFLNIYFPYLARYTEFLNLDFKSVLLSMTFLNNFSPKYINSIVPGQWSIAIEVAFYLLVPLFFNRIKTRAEAKKYSIIFIALSSFLILLTSFIINFIAPGQSPSDWYLNLFFSLPIQLPHFILGFFLFFLIFKDDKAMDKESGAAYKEIKDIFLWTVLIEVIFIGISYLLFGRIDVSIISPRVYIQSILLSFFILFVSKNYLYFSKIKIFSKVVEYIGKVSYSLYLTHWFVLIFITHNIYYLRFFGSSSPYLEFFGLFGLTAILGVVVSSATYLLIEGPGQRLGILIKDLYKK